MPGVFFFSLFFSFCSHQENYKVNYNFESQNDINQWITLPTGERAYPVPPFWDNGKNSLCSNLSIKNVSQFGDEEVNTKYFICWDKHSVARNEIFSCDALDYPEKPLSRGIRSYKFGESSFVIYFRTRFANRESIKHVLARMPIDLATKTCEVYNLPDLPMREKFWAAGLNLLEIVYFDEHFLIFRGTYSTAYFTTAAWIKAEIEGESLSLSALSLPLKPVDLVQGGWMDWNSFSADVFPRTILRLYYEGDFAKKGWMLQSYFLQDERIVAGKDIWRFPSQFGPKPRRFVMHFSGALHEVMDEFVSDALSWLVEQPDLYVDPVSRLLMVHYYESEDSPQHFISVWRIKKGSGQLFQILKAEDFWALIQKHFPSCFAPKVTPYILYNQRLLLDLSCSNKPLKLVDNPFPNKQHNLIILKLDDL